MRVGKIGAAEIEKDKVIKMFSEIVDHWIREVNKRVGQTGVARVVLYGSKASKTSHKSDDIDMLVMTQNYVDKYDAYY